MRAALLERFERAWSLLAASGAGRPGVVLVPESWVSSPPPELGIAALRAPDFWMDGAAGYRV